MGNLAVSRLGKPGDSIKRAVLVKRPLQLCIALRALHRKASRPRRLYSAEDFGSRRFRQIGRLF